MNPTEYTLGECLSAVGVRELPPPIGEGYNKTWLRSIALVLKVGGRQEYVLVENDGHGKPVVKRDFGMCAGIVQFISIHPYEEADKTIVPRFRSNEEIVAYLTKSKYGRAEIEALIQSGDRAEIERRINQVALDLQKKKESEKARVREIKAFAEANPKNTKTNGRKRKQKENNG